ncbi:hypothetical protein [Oceanibaculum pacificum]|uniref:Uncharacterized protein n=1 Tax=Oceanibaculum pacificum TaxID=580166 RepID=A0A154WH64_9PROT|nr:hypothetical protein [Oceanibaculum pacificum]KZD12852.1 hypothetical protein AUP43_00490 [Oceanibaculum pacificum]
MAQISPWSVKGVPYEDRETAKALARQAGLPLGSWLSQLIREANGAPVVQETPPEVSSDSPVSEPLEADAFTYPVADSLSSDVAERRFAALQTQIDALTSLLRDRPPAAMAESIGETGAPLERAVMRLSERVQQLEQEVFNEAPGQAGMIGRLLGRR